MTAERRKALKAALSSGSEAHAFGLAGSAPAMMLAAMPARRQPIMVVGDSLDDAGYLYHDLSRILGEESVLMFPRPTNAPSSMARSTPHPKYCAPKLSTAGMPTRDCVLS